MKLLLINFSVYLTLILSFATDLSAKKLEAHYKVEFGPINIGSLKWMINLNDDTYLTSVYLKDKGLFSGLYNFSGEYLSEGKILNGEFVSSKYKQLWKTKKKKKNVEILFDKTMVLSLSLKPMENEAPRVDYLKVSSLIDPLSSFLNIVVNGKNNFKTIDGRRLYKMFIDFEKKDGDTVTKKIYIKDYFNIWADHKRNDLEFISTKQNLSREEIFFPNSIRVKNKGLVFKLTKI